MRHISTSVLLLFVLLVSSCKKQDHVVEDPYIIRGDYIIMGRVGGKTLPEVTTTYYLVNNGQMRKDTEQRNQAPPESINQFNFHYLMSKDRFMKVADFPAAIPAELLNYPDSSFGIYNNNGASWLDVWATVNGKTCHWKMHPGMDSMSAAVQQFYTRLQNDF